MMFKKIVGSLLYSILALITVLLIGFLVNVIVNYTFYLALAFMMIVLLLFGYVINEQYPLFKKKIKN